MRDFLRVLSLMRPQAGWMALSIALSALATLAHAALMATSGWFITAMAAAGIAGVSMNYFTPAAMIRAFAIVRTGGRYVERLVGHEATLKFVAKLRPWLFGRLEPLAPAALEDERSGDLMTRLRSDIDRLEFAFLRVLQPMVAAVIVIGVGIAFAARHDAAIAAAIAALALLAGLGLPLLIGWLSAAPARRVTVNSADLNARLVDHLEGRGELDIYDPCQRHRAGCLEVSDGLIADEQKVASLAGLAAAGVGLAANAVLVAVIAIGGPKLAAGGIEGPDLVMLALMGLALFEAIGPLPVAMQTLPAFLASARRIFALADRPVPVPEVVAPLSVPETGDLVFERVGFTYPGATRPAVEEVSFTLTPGKRLAIVGASGSGKSSLVSLAMRYRPASAGAIRFAGEPIERYEPEALRRRIAVLAQSDHLFSATIADNLALGEPGVARGRMELACEQAEILDFVTAQPQGFETFIGAHGAKVSGGEGRRLGLARTLLKDAPILVLDEPTEGLDPETEERVLENVLDESRERAVLLITHSRACLEMMDEIIVMEAGRVVAQGAPADVLERV